MNLQGQLASQEGQSAVASSLFSPFSTNFGFLGNTFAQAPAAQGEVDEMVEAYQKLLTTAQPAVKLAALKLKKFTPEGRVHRISTSLAAVNALQPTELSLAEWKEIVEEVEDDEDA